MRIGIVVALCALVLPAAALAKGPSQATITGPGLAKPLTLGGRGGWTADSPMTVLTTRGGFFQVAWGGQPERTLPAPPTRKLGPRYRVVYLVPGPSGQNDRIRQDLYPFAHGGPVTFTAAGQRFFKTRRTLGGWFRAGSELKAAVLEAGIPRPGNEARGASPPADSAENRSITWLAAVLALLALAGGTTVVARRRARPAAA